MGGLESLSSLFRGPLSAYLIRSANSISHSSFSSFPELFPPLLCTTPPTSYAAFQITTQFLSLLLLPWLKRWPSGPLCCPNSLPCFPSPWTFSDITYTESPRPHPQLPVSMELCFSLLLAHRTPLSGDTQGLKLNMIRNKSFPKKTLFTHLFEHQSLDFSISVTTH